MNGIVEHAETYLGVMGGGLMDSILNSSIQVLVFNNAPTLGAMTLMTAGVSTHELHMGVRRIRQEFLYVSTSVDSAIGANILLSVAECILQSHQAVLRGEVIPLEAKFVATTGFEALYCAMPVFLDDKFATYEATEPATIVVWLVPIHKDEADFVTANGWGKFEEVLERRDPNLFDSNRTTVLT